MKALPRVTVLMPVYNTIKYISHSVTSILLQSYGDFEFIIIDDGSTDGTAQYLQHFKDPRIRLILHQQNKGLVYSLNEGIALAKGEFLARMDADDISEPSRFACQVAYLDSHPKVGVLGTLMKFIHNGMEIPKPLDHNGIHCWQLFHTCLSHPSIMLRLDILRRHGIRYDSTYLHAEDYDMWNRLGDVTRLANYPVPLLHYRIHGGQVSTLHLAIQENSAKMVRMSRFRKLGIYPTEEEYATHMQFVNFSIPVHKHEPYARALAWAEKLLVHNRRAKLYDQETLNAVLSQCFTNSQHAQ